MTELDRLIATVAHALVGDPPPAPRPNVHALIACATCRARVDQTCRTAAGVPTHPHALRFAPRLCPCGELPTKAHGSPYCDACRRKADREARRDYMRRRRSLAQTA